MRPAGGTSRSGAITEDLPAASAHRGRGAGRRPSAAAALKRLVRVCRDEPLVHFFALGLVLFLVMQAHARRQDVYRIEVTPAHTAQLARSYAVQFGAPPDPVTLEAVVQRDIHDEVLFRQGRLLGLDRGDEIVRRRIVQKAQFLLDANAPAEPSAAQLRAFYRANAGRYTAPAATTFSHIYFADGPGGEAAAVRRSRQALTRLDNARGRAPELGDAFPDLYDFSAYDQQQVWRLFGRTPLAAAVFTAPLSRWSGPFRSDYGVHLIHVGARTAATLQPFSEVRDQVRADWLREAQDHASAAAYDALARRFVVVRADEAAKR